MTFRKIRPQFVGEIRYISTSNSMLTSSIVTKAGWFLINKSHLSSSTHLFSTMSKGGSIVRASDKIGLKQLFDDDSSTFTYLLWDKESKDCILVDPVDIQSDRDVAEVNALGLNLVYGVNTRKI
jgi:hypothetical protein